MKLRLHRYKLMNCMITLALISPLQSLTLSRVLSLSHSMREDRVVRAATTLGAAASAAGFLQRTLRYIYGITPIVEPVPEPRPARSMDEIVQLLGYHLPYIPSETSDVIPSPKEEKPAQTLIDKPLQDDGKLGNITAVVPRTQPTLLAPPVVRDPACPTVPPTGGAASSSGIPSRTRKEADRDAIGQLLAVSSIPSSAPLSVTLTGESGSRAVVPSSRARVPSPGSRRGDDDGGDRIMVLQALAAAQSIRNPFSSTPPIAPALSAGGASSSSSSSDERREQVVPPVASVVRPVPTSTPASTVATAVTETRAIVSRKISNMKRSSSAPNLKERATAGYPAVGRHNKSSCDDESPRRESKEEKRTHEEEVQHGDCGESKETSSSSVVVLGVPALSTVTRELPVTLDRALEMADFFINDTAPLVATSYQSLPESQVLHERLELTLQLKPETWYNSFINFLEKDSPQRKRVENRMKEILELPWYRGRAIVYNYWSSASEKELIEKIKTWESRYKSALEADPGSVIHIRDVADVSWYFYICSEAQGCAFKEGTWQEKKNDTIFRFLSIIPGKYKRISSHVTDETFEEYGIDIPWELRDKKNFVLPNNKYHLLFFTRNNGCTIIKLETYGTKYRSDQLMHGIEYVSPRDNDSSHCKKERVPGCMVTLYKRFVEAALDADLESDAVGASKAERVKKAVKELEKKGLWIFENKEISPLRRLIQQYCVRKGCLVPTITTDPVLAITTDPMLAITTDSVSAPDPHEAVRRAFRNLIEKYHTYNHRDVRLGNEVILDQNECMAMKF